MNGGHGGPSEGFLSQLGAALQLNGQAREDGGDVEGTEWGPLADAPSYSGEPAAAAPLSSSNEDPGRMMSGGGPQASVMPPDRQMVSFQRGDGEPIPGSPPSDARDYLTNDVVVRAVGGGGGTPAHEAMNKGPEQLGHYMAAFDAPEGAARSQDFRNQLQASHEEAMYAEAAHAAQERETQAKASLVRRQEEMRRTEGQFREQVDMLSQQHLDQGRLFANMGTGEKIVTTLLLGLGSLGGGPNPVVEAINKKVDRDIQAQKFDYDTGMNRAKGLHTAYGMLMDRYHEEDIALAGARTAALDFVMAKANGMRAEWKGTESANTLDAVRGKLDADRHNTMGNAITLIAATAGGGGYEVSVRDRGGMQKLAGNLTAEQARKVQIEQGAKVHEKTEHENTKGGIAATVAALKAKKDGKETPLEKATRVFNVHSAYLDKAASELVGDVPGSTSSKIPGASTLPFGTDARQYQVKLDEYNLMADAILSHALKDANGGRPPASELKRNFDRVEITARTPDDAKLARIKLLRNYSDEAAKSDGVVGAGLPPAASAAGAAPNNAPSFQRTP